MQYINTENREIVTFHIDNSEFESVTGSFSELLKEKFLVKDPSLKYLVIKDEIKDGITLVCVKVNYGYNDKDKYELLLQWANSLEPYNFSLSTDLGTLEVEKGTLVETISKNENVIWETFYNETDKFDYFDAEEIKAYIATGMLQHLVNCVQVDED